MNKAAPCNALPTTVKTAWSTPRPGTAQPCTARRVTTATLLGEASLKPPRKAARAQKSGSSDGKAGCTKTTSATTIRRWEGLPRRTRLGCRVARTCIGMRRMRWGGLIHGYKAHTQSARPDGAPKYKNGYEQHMNPEGRFGDTPHINWYNRNNEFHIF